MQILFLVCITFEVRLMTYIETHKSNRKLTNTHKCMWIIFLLNSFIFNWRIIALQYCIGFYQTISMNQPWVYICPLPPEHPSHLPSHLTSKPELYICKYCTISNTIFKDLIQFSRPVASNSLWHHGLQHAMFLGPSLTPRACSNSCPLSRWCHPTI